MNTHKLLLIVVLAIPFYFLYAQSTPFPTSKTFDLAPFHSLAVASSFNTKISYGNVQEVTVEGNAALIEKLDVQVKNGILTLKMKRGNYNNIDLKFTIVMPTLKEAQLLGSGNIDIGEFKQLEHLKLTLAGSGNIKSSAQLNIQGQLSASIAGSGNICLNGAAGSADISIAGSGDCKMKNFVTDQSKIAISGSGAVNIHAKRHLTVNISGSGDVRYNGQPKIKQQIQGSGSVSAL